MVMQTYAHTRTVGICTIVCTPSVYFASPNERESIRYSHCTNKPSAHTMSHSTARVLPCVEYNLSPQTKHFYSWFFFPSFLLSYVWASNSLAPVFFFIIYCKQNACTHAHKRTNRAGKLLCRTKWMNELYEFNRHDWRRENVYGVTARADLIASIYRRWR